MRGAKTLKTMKHLGAKLLNGIMRRCQSRFTAINASLDPSCDDNLGTQPTKTPFTASLPISNRFLRLSFRVIDRALSHNERVMSRHEVLIAQAVAELSYRAASWRLWFVQENRAGERIMSIGRWRLHGRVCRTTNASIDNSRVLYKLLVGGAL